MRVGSPFFVWLVFVWLVLRARAGLLSSRGLGLPAAQGAPFASHRTPFVGEGAFLTARTGHRLPAIAVMHPENTDRFQPGGECGNHDRWIGIDRIDRPRSAPRRQMWRQRQGIGRIAACGGQKPPPRQTPRTLPVFCRIRMTKGKRVALKRDDRIVGIRRQRMCADWGTEPHVKGLIAEVQHFMN